MTTNRVCCGHFNTAAHLLRVPAAWISPHLDNPHFHAPETVFYNTKAAAQEGSQKDIEHNWWDRL